MLIALFTWEFIQIGSAVLDKVDKLHLNRVLLIPGTGNGERGTGNRERESGNECTAVIRIRIQNGGRKHGNWSGNQF